MQKYKGTGLILLKKMFSQQTPEVQQAFVGTLGPEERQVYDMAMATQWLPIAVAATIFEKAAAAFYPGNLRGLEEVGRQQARDNLAGIYRPLLRVLTISFAMQQVAKLWRSYFDEGEGSAHKEAAENRGEVMVENYPALPLVNRRVVSGYIQGVVELCGAKDVRVSLDESRPEKWSWTVTWR